MIWVQRPPNQREWKMSKSQDVPGECNAQMILGDDHGDNECTFRCPLPEGHEGPHQERCCQNKDGPGPRNILIQWEGDDRRRAAWVRFLFTKWWAAGEPTGEPEADWAGWAEQCPEDWDWRAHLPAIEQEELKHRIWGEYVSRRWTAAGEPSKWDGWDEPMPVDFDWEKYRHLLTEGI